MHVAPFWKWERENLLSKIAIEYLEFIVVDIRSYFRFRKVSNYNSWVLEENLIISEIHCIFNAADFR